MQGRCCHLPLTDEMTKHELNVSHAAKLVKVKLMKIQKVKSNQKAFLMNNLATDKEVAID